jgi:hypothetical protein
MAISGKIQCPAYFGGPALLNKAEAGNSNVAMQRDGK